MIYAAKWAEKWTSAWNTRDLDLLLTFYAEKAMVHSPFAKLVTNDGVIKGKESLREYWGQVMWRMPNYRLELIAVYSGHLAVAVQCKDDSGRDLIETMLFDEQEKVVYETACIRR